jgi:hypothetical protein
MTTTVIVHAHCASNKEVKVSIHDNGNEEVRTLQDGEKAEVYAYDKRVITVLEVEKL